jgi:hypothetical protein
MVKIMQVEISNQHLDPKDVDIQFHQPKFYFGQMLNYGKFKDGKNKFGIVMQMRFTGGYWSYSLFNLETEALTDWYPESELSAAILEKVG